MSPATKSKSKERGSVKEQKAPSKHSITNGNASASAYNPVSGTFHMLDSVNVSLNGSTHNGRFQNKDENDDHSGPLTASTDCDSISNNGSCSGESEDQKDKNGAVKSENPPGLVGGNDRREKIRQKNEKKHQRQKEKRAQELRDRCTGYLMSRKLESLSQQLVGMGFPSDRATVALIMTEGRVEDAVNWLLEGGDAHMKEGQHVTGNIKIDIADELAHIAAMEIKFHYQRAEVERAVVSCEGNIEKAAEMLRSRRQEVSPPRVENKTNAPAVKLSRDIQSPNSNNRQLPISLQAPAQRVNSPIQVKSSNTMPRRDEKDFNYTKARPQPAPSKVAQSEVSGKVPTPLRRVQSKSEWQRPTSPAEKKVFTPGSWTSTATPSSISYPVSSSLQIGTSASKPLTSETRHRSVGVDTRPVGSAASEPTTLQPSQTPYTSLQFPIVSSAAMTAPASVLVPSSGWSDNYVDGSPVSNISYSNVAIGNDQFKVNAVGKGTDGNAIKGIADIKAPFRPFMSTPLDSVRAGWNSGPSSTILSPLMSSSPVPSSGFYNGWNNLMPGSTDWSKGPVYNGDYTNIDWSISSPSSSDASYTRYPSINNRLLDNVNSEGGLHNIPATSNMPNENNGSYDLWQPSNRLNSNSGIRLQEQTVNESEHATSVALHEWTTPFAGKDLFTLPRKMVSSPPL